MYVTVAVCTRNRSASLSKTLESLAAMVPVDCEWELLVVDNGSTDDTPTVVAGFDGRLPLRRVVEAKSGAANARNTAAAAARGIYIVWTDDDVIVDQHWLAKYVEAFAHWPDAALFGGRIDPVLVAPVKPWFPGIVDLVQLPLAARDLGQARPLAADPDWIPYGANFAVRTDVQRHFPFNPELGPGKLHYGEETTAFLEMLSAGHTGRWLPDCSVRHMITPERQTEAYIARWFEGLGRTTARNGEALDGPHIFGAPRWLWRRMVLRTVGYYVARLHAPPADWMAKLIAVSQDRGRIRHFRSSRRI